MLWGWLESRAPFWLGLWHPAGRRAAQAGRAVLPVLVTWLLADFALGAVAAGFEGAGNLLGGEGGDFWDDLVGVADVFFGADGGFFDVGGAEGAR